MAMKVTFYGCDGPILTSTLTDVLQLDRNYHNPGIEMNRVAR